MPGFSTRAIRAASHQAEVTQTPVTVPIYQTSTFEVGSAAELEELLEFRRPGHSYTRYSNPTHAALEGALAELEGGEAALATASGMAAIHGAMLSIVRSGDEVLLPAAVYGGTIGLFGTVMPRLGITRRTVRSGDTGAVVAAIGPQTVAESTQLSLTASATDADLPAQTLTYSLVAAPTGAAINATTGAFTWTPGESDGPGSFPVTIRATDGITPVEVSFTITVTEANVAPVLDAIANQSVNEGALLTVNASATDASTYTRSSDMQDWPVLAVDPHKIAELATSRSAVAVTIAASLPPSSRKAGITDPGSGRSEMSSPGKAA